jgi:hypothetical protein
MQFSASFRVALGFICVVFLIFAWPAGPAFAVCLALLLWANQKKIIWATAARSALLPLTLGFAAVSLLCLMLPLFSLPTLRDSRFVEFFLVDLRMAIHEFEASFGFFRLVGILFVLLILTSFAPKLKAASRFSQVTSWIHGLLLFLVAATTFTLFSDKPLTHAAEADLQRSRIRVKVALRTEYESVGRFLITEEVKTAVENFSAPERRHIATLACSIKDVNPCLIASTRVAIDDKRKPASLRDLGEKRQVNRIGFDSSTESESVARQMAHDAAKRLIDGTIKRDLLSELSSNGEANSAVSQPHELAISRLATSPAEWSSQHAEVRIREEAARKTELQASETEAALGSFFFGPSRP